MSQINIYNEPQAEVIIDENGTPVTVVIGANGAVWGQIGGTLSNQTDLQNALNAKVPYSGATGNVTLGEYGITAGYVQLDTTPTTYTPAVGNIGYNDTTGTLETTLKGGNVQLKIGRDMFERVVNKTGVQLTKASYQAVRISDAQGQRLAVALAQANNDNNSADTLGLAVETIDNNQEGNIFTLGEVSGINTTGSLQGETWIDGDVLYLSPTTAGRITNVKPVAPQHLVVIGYVVYSHANNGKIYVKVMNGWELGELHDVNTTGATAGQVLKYNGTIWAPSADAGVTGSGIAGQVAYWNSASTITSNFKLSFSDSTGLLGINTFTPNYRVNAVGTASTNNGIVASELLGREIGIFSSRSTTGQAALSVISNHALTFETVGTERARLTTTGNLLLGTTTDLASSILTMDSTTKGFLRPRMTTVQRDAIVSPATGLSVYNTTTNKVNYYNGTAWTEIQDTITNPVTGTGTSGQVAYWSGTTTQTGSSTFLWNGTTLSIGGTTVFSPKVYINGLLEIADGQGITNGASLTNGEGVRFSSAFGLNLFATGQNVLRIFNTTRNVAIQNGGTFTDSGQRLQVTGTTLLNGALTVSSGGAAVTGLSSFTGTTASDGGQLGSELLSSANWTLGAGWTGDFVSGFAHSSGTATLTNTLAAVTNNYYLIAYTVTGRTAGSFTIDFGGTTTSSITATGSTGPRATSTGTLVITPTTDFNGTIVFSIKVISASSASIQLRNSSGTITNEIRNSSSISNTLIGLNAGRQNLGTNNTIIGQNAGLNNTTGLQNIFIGRTSGSSNTIGSSNTFVGNNSGNSNIVGNSNSYFGNGSGQLANADNNSYFGAGTGVGTTTGSSNSFFGSSVANANTTGSNNSFFGSVSGYSNNGSGNSFFGYYTAFSLSTGNNNTILGNESGRFISSGSNLTSLDNSVLVGSQARVNANSETNQTVIGYQAIGLGSNTTVIGNSSTTFGRWWGNLLIGSSVNGGQALQVTGDTLLKGSGNTSATTALTVQNSSSANIFRIRNDGRITFSSLSEISAPFIQPSNGQTALNIDGSHLYFGNANIDNSNGGPAGYWFEASFSAASGGQSKLLNLTGTFTGGTGAEHTNLRLGYTINQAVGATGITRGLYVNPTLTSAADWRSIEWSNNSGWGLYGAGTAQNFLAGNLGIGTTTLNNSALRVNKAITGAVTQSSIANSSTINSDVTSNAWMYVSSPSTQASSFTLSELVHFNAFNLTIGLGSSITNNIGFKAESNLTGATNNYGFFGNIASGTGRWNLYMNGTALNYLNGSLLIGTTTDAGFKLDVNGTARVSGALSIGTGLQLSDTGGVSTITSLVNNAVYRTQLIHRFQVTASNTDVLAINNTGNVLINTLSDAGFKLDVNGTARIQNDLTISDTRNIILATTTGTKIGTATSQKLGFWNATPIVQPTTGVASATRVGGGGTTLTDTDTFDGYTIAKLVKALRDLGLLA